MKNIKKNSLVLLGVVACSLQSCIAVMGNGNPRVPDISIPKIEIPDLSGILDAGDFGNPSDVKAKDGTFKIVPLKYQYNDVSAYIDARTMFTHFSKHYVGYLNNLNAAVAGKPQAKLSIENLLKSLDMSNATLRNNAGGYYNHNMYFEVISKNGGGEPTGKLAEAIKRDFGSFDAFKKQFSEAGAKQFGSGWAWLVKDSAGKLKIGSTANQDNPLMPNLSISGEPILAMDVWEHAYYLKYQNRRVDYIDNFFKVVDWNKVSEWYSK